MPEIPAQNLLRYRIRSSSTADVLRAIVVQSGSSGLCNYGGTVAIKSSHGKSPACNVAASVTSPATLQRRQRGAIALALMLMLGVLIGVLVISFARSVQVNNAADTRSTLAMAKAREALLGYATTYRDTHPNEVFGYFPCPDMGTGTEDNSAAVGLHRICAILVCDSDIDAVGYHHVLQRLFIGVKDIIVIFIIKHES